MRYGVFVTGTDTGVGKTVVMAALAMTFAKRGYSVGMMKPIETGVGSQRTDESDAGRLRRASGNRHALAQVRPFAFRKPLAPLDAARLEGRAITLPTIVRAFHTLAARHEVILVEGVGGVYVPITQSLMVIDLIDRMNIPVLVVGRTGLGGINHALLTLAALRRRQIPLLALVLNRPTPSRTATARAQEASTTRLLRSCAGVPVIGPLPYLTGVSGNWQKSVARLARTPDIKKLAKLALASGQGTL
jgi:dethiobiotin synthetase